MMVRYSNTHHATSQEMSLNALLLMNGKLKGSTLYNVTLCKSSHDEANKHFMLYIKSMLLLIRGFSPLKIQLINRNIVGFSSLQLMHDDSIKQQCI